MAAGWLLGPVQGLLLYQHGIETAYGSDQIYRRSRQPDRKGTVTTPNFWLYSTQIFLIAAIKQIHAGYWLVALGTLDDECPGHRGPVPPDHKPE